MASDAFNCTFVGNAGLAIPAILDGKGYKYKAVVFIAALAGESRNDDLPASLQFYSSQGAPAPVAGLHFITAKVTTPNPTSTDDTTSSLHLFASGDLQLLQSTSRIYGTVITSASRVSGSNKQESSFDIDGLLNQV